MKISSPRTGSAPAGPARPAPSGAGPVRVLRLGRLKAAVWENAADQRVFYSVTFTRTYVDEQKQFRDADSFGRDDLLLLAKLADLAHTFVCERAAGARPEEAPA